MMRKKNLINEIGTDWITELCFDSGTSSPASVRNNGHEIDIRRLMKLDLRESKIEGDGG